MNEQKLLNTEIEHEEEFSLEQSVSPE